MKRNRIVLFLGSIAMLVAVTFIHFGCKHDPVVFSNVCFESEVLPIFLSNCSMCHGPDKSAGDIRLDSYDNIIKEIKKGDAKGSKIYKAVSSGSMPPSSKPRLSGKQIALIYSWIQLGAENTTGCGIVDSTGCDTTNVKYSTVISSLLNSACMSCHFAGGDNTDFSTYTALSTYLASNTQMFLDNINQVTGSNPMPPSGKLDSCSIKKIQAWIHAGHPNN